MPRIGRYQLSEISINRILSALRMRWREFPHTLSWIFSNEAYWNKNRLAGLKNRHKGERCIIVANGPSLKMTNLDSIKNEVTFGLNRIYLFFDQTVFRPTYYVTVNELILEQFCNDIAELKMPKFLNWNQRSHYETPDSGIYFLKSKMVINDFFQYDVTNPLVVGATVTFVALQLAYYMGFQEVVIVGLDHNYAETGQPSETEVRTTEQDRSHFHPQYFPKGSRWQLPDLMRSEIDFRLARKSFEADGRRIFDATIGGKCQVFEKLEFSSIKFK